MRVSIQSLTKSFGGRELFRDFSLELDAGTRLSVVGANGTGKSTLLRMLAGVSAPDSGRVVFPREARVGYVAQELAGDDLDTPLLSWVLAVLPSWSEFWSEWERAAADGDEAAMKKLAARQAELEQRFGYNPEHHAHAVLSGLGFAEDEQRNPLATFSGGWRERAKLARVLVAGADVLLLDEPTNHLDLEAVEWLEEYLLGYQGVLVFVAHDRVFLDRVGTHVLFLGGGKPQFRRGTFSGFLAWQEEMSAQREREEQRLAAEIERKMEFVRRFKAKATKARQAVSKKRQAERLEKELADAGARAEPRRKTLSFRWPEPKRSDKTVASAVDLAFSYNGDAVWQGLDFSLYRGQRVALVGPNGCGKSTLLKVLAGELQASSGYVETGSNVDRGYYSQHQLEVLQPERSTLAEIRRLADPRTTEQELMSVLGLFMLGQGYFDRPVQELSGGEKSRLLLASLFLARANFLLMDEPTNHLDLESRQGLLEALDAFPGTLLVVAHDRWLLAEAVDEVWELTPAGLEIFLGGYEEYERVRRARREAPEPPQAGAELSSGEPRPGLSREEQKRRKRDLAEQRNALYRELQPRQEAYASLERDLEQALQRVDETERLLADPKVYADGSRTAELLKEYHAWKETSESLLEKMAGLEDEITRLEERQKQVGAPG